MSFVSAITSRLAPLASPSTYKTAFMNMRTVYDPQVRAGKFMPMIHLMLAIGTIGYVQEYYAIGRFHVAHAQHEKEAALAEYKEKHGSHH
mmetsp:Transcript_14677/g.30160  ORF Transcript_14677/g.30160 Transcript_14677/m.30160 type:complete len:90 (-) Transcript_14677:131-400(-)|eukprot:CAMPEP_0118666822 /NCGR_PEP_ID=MMETSP0785-20121206/19433_1 /TAXON_ID=91992 /ORGANISM="Bolidomonas pacifica, Strain CCMP 1866" /LENGTH=89 /DNA_ID=CAMNT_0006561185 /DNA_START=11 /DNA_END=280 /DNA_ORIENTATION=-